jgi:cytosine/adenosine deaminase-related metal-dependent hydrolase
MPFALQARLVFPVDRPPIEQGVVTVDGERIVGVGHEAFGNAALFHLGDVALMPALVNAHTHLEFSNLPHPLGRPGIALADWIPLVISERRTQEHPSAAIAAGVQESLLAGVGTVGEIATADIGAYSNIRGIDLLPFLEVIGFSRARADSALQAVIERMDDFPAKLGASTEGSCGFRLGFSPHAPYTVSPALVIKLVSLARERSLIVAMHLAESVDELELLADGTGRFQQLLEERSMWDPRSIPGGSTPFDYLEMLALAPRALVIHGNYLDRDERKFLATHAENMSLVYCPRTHAYFRHPPYPLRELLAAGVRVALGSDSRASNPDLSVLSEMRHVARTHPAIAPDEILRMGTLSGAEALGQELNCGSISPGRLANLVAIPLTAGAHATSAETLEALFSADDAPKHMWVRGQAVALNSPF